MGVSFYIDGRPAECCEDYNEVIGQLGAAPDESRNRFELWTTQPRGRLTSRSVWLNPGSNSGRADWLADGAATLQSSQDYGGSEDYLSQGKSCISFNRPVHFSPTGRVYIVGQDETPNRFSHVSKEKP